MTPTPWNIAQPGGPAGPFWSIVNQQGRVVALQILSEADARSIAAAVNERAMLRTALEQAAAALQAVIAHDIDTVGLTPLPGEVVAQVDRALDMANGALR